MEHVVNLDDRGVFAVLELLDRIHDFRIPSGVRAANIHQKAGVNKRRIIRINGIFAILLHRVRKARSGLQRGVGFVCLCARVLHVLFKERVRGCLLGQVVVDQFVAALDFRGGNGHARVRGGFPARGVLIGQRTERRRAVFVGNGFHVRLEGRVILRHILCRGNGDGTHADVAFRRKEHRVAAALLVALGGVEIIGRGLGVGVGLGGEELIEIGFHLVVRRSNALGYLGLQRCHDCLVLVAVGQEGAEAFHVHIHVRGVKLLLEDFVCAGFHIRRAFGLRLRTEGAEVGFHLRVDLGGHVGLLGLGQNDAHLIGFVDLNLFGNERGNGVFLHCFNVLGIGGRGHAIVGIHLNHAVVTVEYVALGDGEVFADLHGNLGKFLVAVLCIRSGCVGIARRIGFLRAAREGQHQSNRQQRGNRLLPCELHNMLISPLYYSAPCA